ncbi:translocation/assembly module TamB domain-containing protein [Methylobacillus gramineus]|uniref:translocation/assembly module TamB domain-containing protein n=1 Tax=Methylobacillus gramineus TaxID=755169 RepID=UPI001CFFA335|nr:translocation/assembly module TamB domain-containing protein [Methylobacillus gramineus]MCB5184667.1 translocation/assembly module TamB domain-containing protein [Methylobacillus gramineus]
MLQRLILVWLLWLAVPAWADIQVDSSLQDLSYDAGSMQLNLEQFDSKVRMLPTLDGRVLVERLHAQRLVITMKPKPEASSTIPALPAPGETPAPAGLPEKINLPFPIRVDQAAIDEIIIVSGSTRHVLHHVTLNLEADTKKLNLELVRAETPWGDIQAMLSLVNSKPYPLAGHIHVKQVRGGMPYELNSVLSGDLLALRFDMSNLFAMQQGLPAMVSVDSGLQSAGKLDIHGELGLEGDFPLKLRVALRDLNPGQLGQSTQANLGFDLALDGKLMPEPDLRLQLNTHNSRWRGQALNADANIHLLGNLLNELVVKADLGGNTFSANGSLGKSDSKLDWQADFANLGVLGPAFGGKTNARGSLSGSMDTLSAQFQLLAENLRLPGNISARKLEGNGTLDSAGAGTLQATINAQGLRLQQGSFIDGKLMLSGNRQQHQISLQANGTGLELISVLTGGFDANGGWAGQLKQLDYKSDVPVSLPAPAPISYDDENGLLVENLALQFKQGRITLESLQSTAQGLITRGKISQLALHDIPPALFSLPGNLKGNPVFSGHWNIRAEDALNGEISLWRESGDLAVVTEGQADKPLGLQTVKLGLTMQENQLQLQASINGSQFGHVTANASTTINKNDTGFELASSAPLQAEIHAQLSTLAWLPVPEVQADGQMDIAIQASGQLGNPDLQGYIRGSNLALGLPAEGVSLTQGRLNAKLSGDKLQLNELRFTGGEGSLSASGEISLNQGKPAVDIAWVLDNFTAAKRTDRLLVLQGNARTTMKDHVLDVSGDLRVVRGLIELAGEGAPQLGDDVVVVGLEREEEESPLQFNISGLKINLGDEVIGIIDTNKQFLMRGRGLDGYLTGILTLSGMVPNSLRAEGSIRVGGTYMAYGQILNIEKGIINFSGPIDNPGLNISAMRDNQTVKAGVEITGNALMPTVKLVSTPNVPDSDKLSWLVLGHGMDQAGKSEFAMLSLAAGALLSQGQSVPLQTRMARAAGLDSFSIGGSDVQSSSVNFGKRLSSKLYLSYEKSLTGLLNVAKLTYAITKRWSVVSQAGSESAVDVLYTFRFK